MGTLNFDLSFSNTLSPSTHSSHNKWHGTQVTISNYFLAKPRRQSLGPEVSSLEPLGLWHFIERERKESPEVHDCPITVTWQRVTGDCARPKQEKHTCSYWWGYNPLLSPTSTLLHQWNDFLNFKPAIGCKSKQLGERTIAIINRANDGCPYTPPHSRHPQDLPKPSALKLAKMWIIDLL